MKKASGNTCIEILKVPNLIPKIYEGAEKNTFPNRQNWDKDVEKNMNSNDRANTQIKKSKRKNSIIVSLRDVIF
jgi:hypothetical protein